MSIKKISNIKVVDPIEGCDKLIGSKGKFGATVNMCPVDIQNYINGGYKHLVKTITQAEILASTDAAPIEILAAPAPGSIHIIGLPGINYPTTLTTYVTNPANPLTPTNPATELRILNSWTGVGYYSYFYKQPLVTDLVAQPTPVVFYPSPVSVGADLMTSTIAASQNMSIVIGPEVGAAGWITGEGYWVIDFLYKTLKLN